MLQALTLFKTMALFTLQPLNIYVANNDEVLVRDLAEEVTAFNVRNSLR